MLGVGVSVTVVLGWLLHHEAVALDRRRLAIRVAEIQAQLDARIEKSEMLLHNLRDYLRLSGEPREKVFQRWCYENGLTINTPWIHGIAVATNRNRVSWRQELPNNPAAWTTAERDLLTAVASRNPIDCRITLRSEVRDGKQFLEDYGLRPAFTNVRYGLKSVNPGVRNDWLALSVRQSSRLGMSDRRIVMLDAKSNAIMGTLFHVPVHSPEFDELLGIEAASRDRILSTMGPAARWLDLESVVIAPLDFSMLVRSLWEGTPADMGIEIFSSTTNLTGETWMNATAVGPRAADREFKPYLVHHQIWPMYGMKFSIFFYTTPLFEAQSPRRVTHMAVASGFAITLLATALVGVAVRARNRQDRLTLQIRDARDALAAAQRERERIGRDLHDGTIQSLYAIQLGLGHTVENLEAAPAHARSELSAVRREMDTVIAEIRQFITAGAEAEQAVDFGAVLHALAQRARSGTAAQIGLHCEPGAVARLSEDQAVHLANITREALSNALRHGRPQRVDIALREEAAAVVLEIADDGAGFEPSGMPPSSVGGPRGVGLTSMRARVQEVGGNLEIRSVPGQGTRVVVRVPAPAAEIAEGESAGDPTEDL